MKKELEVARERLAKLVEEHEITRGLYVRVRRGDLILGRQERLRPEDEPQDSDRLRLTPLGGGRFGLSVLRHTGRWEKTPFSGTLEELVELTLTTLQHLVAPWP